MQNRQGNDQDSQYQTGVYYTNKRAREMVKYIAEIERDRSKKFLWSSAHLKNYCPADGSVQCRRDPHHYLPGEKRRSVCHTSHG
ncbi:MAG: peptide-methionine (S)-S-oxide reductase [Angelakisella sp.]